MHHRPAFEMFRNQAHFLFHGQIIIGQFSDAKTKRTILEDQIRRAIVINELANIRLSCPSGRKLFKYW